MINEQISEEFKNRSIEKRRYAMTMLAVGIIIIVIGMFTFLSQLSAVSQQLQELVNQVNKVEDKELREKLIASVNNTIIPNAISRIVFMLIVFFLAQIFLKLYRYHLNIADFYISCFDAARINITMTEKNDAEQFVLLQKTLNPLEKLDLPDSPSLQGIIK